MGLLRDRHESLGTQYRMREKLFSIGDDFWIETEDGERAFKVERQGAAGPRDVRPREPVRRGALQDPGDASCASATRWRSSRTARTVATVKKALVSPLRERYSIEVEDGERPRGEGQHRRPRVQDRARRRQGGRGLQALVPRPRHLRDRDRARRRRCADPHRRRLHRPDGPPRLSDAEVRSRESRLRRVLERRDFLHLLTAVVTDEHVAHLARVLRIQPDARVVAGMPALFVFRTGLKRAKAPTRHLPCSTGRSLTARDPRLKRR